MYMIIAVVVWNYKPSHSFEIYRGRHVSKYLATEYIWSKGRVKEHSLEHGSRRKMLQVKKNAKEIS